MPEPPVPTQWRGDRPYLLYRPVAADDLPELSLVLSSVGLDHEVDVAAGNLLVDEEDYQAAIGQLRAYALENQGWPPLPPEARAGEALGGGHLVTLLLLAALVAFYQVSGPWTDQALLFQVGAVDREAIREQGQWWRLVTALTLHADEEHLTGNVLIGGGLVYFLCRHLGFGLAPLLLLASGALGNLLNITLRQSQHLSVGFSTALFACIGLFTGGRMFGNRSLAAILLPLGSGTALLAFLGAEGERTDLGAHFFGFLAGILMGLLFEAHGLRGLRRHAPGQVAALLLACLLVGASWWLALG